LGNTPEEYCPFFVNGTEMYCLSDRFNVMKGHHVWKKKSFKFFRFMTIKTMTPKIYCQRVFMQKRS